MSERFFEKPILNSPYEYPRQHWELDEEGQPTETIAPQRREARFISPIPKAKKRGKKQKQEQAELALDEEAEKISGTGQDYRLYEVINDLRKIVDTWRELPDHTTLNVTPVTQRLLQHWRHHQFIGLRPFFCQVEAAEMVIWLTEVAPKVKEGKRFIEHLETANDAANPGLPRLALKLATGAGKTTVMAMIIAWQTINAIRRPGSKNFTKGFLIITPGITIRDRLRVLQPNDPNSYYERHELVPSEMAGDIPRAQIVITNYHAFGRRTTMDISKGGKSLLEGRDGEKIQTIESEGQMLQRVCPELLGMKHVMVINDEAHHCYREKPPEEDEEGKLTGDELEDAKKNKEAARQWISGIEALQRKIKLNRIVDLSATPFFLSGSRYREGTLFPWTLSDFSLMDAIECGIVKLPRVPITDNLPQGELPMFRNLWEHIGTEMPKKRAVKGQDLDPLSIPVLLQSALEALYGHYKTTHDEWKKAKISTPPCFIVVCQNTSISKLVFEYISGFERQDEDGSTNITEGRLELFRNFDSNLNRLGKPNTLLIDSVQLESGEAIDKNFRKLYEPEIERFRRDIIERTGDRKQAEKISDIDLIREVMNTVGKKNQLGEQIRCVVSVGMLTEGWDANNVTHILGIRAFTTQLLCEQVVGRALRRQSYDLNEDDLFNVEYADIFGIPFDFTAKAVAAPPQKPRETVHVKAMSPERDDLEIIYPRVTGYRVELPKERLEAKFSADCRMVLNRKSVGPTETENRGIIGEGVDMNLDHTGDLRQSTLLYNLTRHLIFNQWRDANEEPKLHLFYQLLAITRQWLDEYLECTEGTFPAQLMYQDLADQACERITHGIFAAGSEGHEIHAMLDPYNSQGSTRHVNFTTSRQLRWETDSRRCHVNWAILDSGWEAEFCRVAEKHPQVRAYVKNHSLGFEVPYKHMAETRKYRPDFIVLVEDGHGEDDLLRLVVEIKGYRREDAKDKKLYMENYWVPGVNRRHRPDGQGGFGRWAFAEFCDVETMAIDFEEEVASHFDRMIDDTIASQVAPQETSN